MTNQMVSVAANLNDLLFLNRNKSYGAYELRKNYDKRLTAALFAAVSFCTLVLWGLNNFQNHNKMSTGTVPHIKDTVVVTTCPPIPPIPHVHIFPAKSQVKSGRKYSGVRVTKSAKDEDTTEMAFMGGALSTLGGNLNGGGNFQDFGISSLGQRRIELPLKKQYESFPEIQAQFPGGQSAYEKYLKGNIKYPTFAVENQIEGLISLAINIDENGEIEDVQVMKGIGGGCNDEVVRVIKGMPRWIPGKKDGENIAVVQYVTVHMIINMR